MFISDKFALYRMLNNYIATSGSTLFLRTGSSDDLPNKLQDLAASSVAAINMVYKTQTTGSDNFLRRLYSRSRSLQPLGGYGQKRTYPINGANVLTYQVVPETVLTENTAGVQSPDVMAIRAGMFGDTSAITLAAGQQTLDFGRNLRFRGMSVYTNLGLSGSQLLYQATDGRWQQVQPSLSNGEYQFDFTARRLRIIHTGSGSATVAGIQFWAERGTEFAVRPITHGVLVPNLLPASYNSIMDITKIDYLSLVLDVGADIKLNVSQTGKLGHLAVQDYIIPVKTMPRQGA